MSGVKAIRGATQVAENSSTAISAAAQELLSEMLRANAVEIPDVISIILTASPDLNASFPASAARDIGFTDTALLCAVEIDVPGALSRVVRILVHSNVPDSQTDISHIYLHGAKSLRTDIAN
jgi:chorismate mutase